MPAEADGSESSEVFPFLDLDELAKTFVELAPWT